MDKKSKIIFTIIVILAILSVVSLTYKVVIIKNFEVVTTAEAT